MTLLDRTTRLTDPVEQLQAQLAALARWHEELRHARSRAEQPGLSREERLDATRQLEARLREHAVLLERVDGAVEAAGPLRSRVPARAVVAHRHPWTRETLAQCLREQGVEVLAAVESGADAVALAVLEQPALLVVDQALAMRSGAEVIEQVRRFSPSTVVGGYVPDESAVPVLLDAGAHLVCTRRVPPADVVASLVALLDPPV